jgi:hypothetical protein
MSEGKQKQPVFDDDQILRTLNHRFLLISGYLEPQIANLGDLAKLTSAQIYDLLHKKTMESLGPQGTLGKRKVTRLSKRRPKRR